MRERFRNLLKSPRFQVLADQGMQSCATFVAMLVEGRHASQEVFAAYVIAYSITGISLGAQKSLLFLPLLNHKSHAKEEVHALEWTPLAIIFNLLGFFLTALCLFLAVVLGSDSHVALAAIFAILMLPGSLMNDACRRMAYMEHDGVVATQVTAIFSMTLGVGVLSYAINPELTLAIPAAFAVGGVLSASWFYRVSLRKSGSHYLRPKAFTISCLQWVEQRTNTLWQFSSFLAYSVYNTALPVLVGILGGARVVAVTAASYTLITPVLTIIGALDGVEKPMAGRAFREGGVLGLRKTLRQSRRRLLLLVGLPALAVAVGSYWLLRLAYGEKYLDAWPLGIPWAAFAIITVVVYIQETELILLRRARRLAISKYVSALACMAFLYPAVKELGAFGAALACSVAIFVNCLMNWRRNET